MVVEIPTGRKTTTDPNQPCKHWSLLSKMHNYQQAGPSGTSALATFPAFVLATEILVMFKTSVWLLKITSDHLPSKHSKRL